MKRNRNSNGFARQQGFTLTELMIALVIMGLIMSVVYRVFTSQDRFFRNQEQIASMQENLRATTEYVNQELSWLGYQVPGLAVVKASPTDIIYKANIPNTGTTIQFVRYEFDATNNTIRRAAGPNPADVTSSALEVMASDIEAVAFSYLNQRNNVLSINASDPLCSDELLGLSPDPCLPGDAGDDKGLMSIQRIKARITARTSKPDWMYTDPEGGPNPNFRKRRAVLDLRARNAEDMTTENGMIVSGFCGNLVPANSVPGGTYAACPDREYYNANFSAVPGGFADNPSITIQAYDKDGNLNTNANQVTYVYAVADDGTPYNIYDSSDAFNVNNTIANGEVRYLHAQDLSKVTDGTTVYLTFAYSDGYCPQETYDDALSINISGGSASQLYMGGAYSSGGLSVEYVDNGGSPITLGSPPNVAMCSTVGNERINLGIRLDDDCGNGISGETVTWSDGGFGGSFMDTTDNLDGTYSATYVPPDFVGAVASVHTANLTANWGTVTASMSQGFIAAEAHDIVIDSITDITGAGIFQFASNVLPRAAQLGGNSGNSFAIERVDGQEVGITFHVEDKCGNRVFESMSINHSASLGNVSSLVDNGDGSYSFAWESNIGCGLEQLGETITISTSAIANPSTQSETISFDLLTTASNPNVSGPFVLVDTSPLGKELQAGNTSDLLNVQATLQQYDPVKQYCTNLLAGSMNPFAAEFTVAGDIGGNASFIAVSPFDVDTKTVNTDAMGIAQVDVFSGTADWDDAVTLTAAVNVEGAIYSMNVSLPYTETNHPQDDSGFYQDSLYTTEIGKTPDIKAVTTFDPGDDLYLQIFDYDENENPLAQDSFSSPYDVEVTVESSLTQDVEVVGLTEELSGNSPNFRKTLQTRFFAAVATTLEKGDGVLQVRTGDTVSMTYTDKDNPGDTETWTIETPGADSFRIFKVGLPDEEILPPADPTQVPVIYGDKLRPELSLPFLAGDGRISIDTVRITVDSGADTDIVVLREDGDTGIMVPDDTVYPGKHFTVAASDPTDADDILATPTTPRYVTLDYDAAGMYPMNIQLFMRDFDPPQVTITSPADTDTVSGAVTVLVDASDVANATTWAGIDRVELYINSRLVETILAPPDLSGSNTFTWTTASGTIPFWLDGSHVLTAKAYDTSGNEAVSAPVNVTLANNLDPIRFNTPGYNTIWSQDVGVQIEVVNLAAEAGTHQLHLYVNGAYARSFTVTGPGTFDHTVDTTVLPEGAAWFMAIIQDTGGGYQTTSLDYIVDRTPPLINIGWPFDQAWINRADFPLDVQATITDFKFAPADPNDVDDATVRAQFSGACASGPLSMSEVPAGSDTYTVFWGLPSCDNREGVFTITIEAYDMASPPNLASRAFSTMVDTKKPTVDTLDVIPYVNQPFTMGSLTLDGFVRGDVTLQATVTDAYPSTGAFAAWYYNDPFVMAGPPDGTQYMPLENFQDASPGSFMDLWPTTAYPTGIYVLAAGVVDAAGNSNDTSPVRYLYLDNNEPWINMPNLPWMFTTFEPVSGWWVPLVRGQVNVDMMADDWGGFLRKVEHRYVNAGDDPGTADTPSPFVLNTVSYSFPADSLKRSFAKSYLIDTCGVPPGTYDVFAFATDWAGNKSPFMGTTRFVIEDFTYLVPPSAAQKVSYFNETLPGVYELLAEGRIERCGNPVINVNVDMNFYRWIWDSMGMVYNFDTFYGTTAMTDLLGDLPLLSSMGGPITYKANQLGATEYIDPVSGNIYAVFHPMFLASPQPYVDNYPPWFTEFEPFNQRRLLTNVTYDLTPWILPSYALELSGKVIFNSGHEAVNEPVTMEIWYTDPIGSPMYTMLTTVTDGSGSFSFSQPTDISITDWFNINIKHPSSYWGDTWMGWIDWDPWMGGWREDLE